jgi:hypothetical protein
MIVNVIFQPAFLFSAQAVGEDDALGGCDSTGS